jgi:hypothetical protein
MKSKFSLIGVTLATPALTAAGEPAMAHVPGADLVQSASIDGEASAALKQAMLSIDPAEKLSLAGDTILLASVARTSGAPILLAKSSENKSGRTNTDIPECQSPTSASGSGTTITGKSGRTNTDIPECHSPSSVSGSGVTATGKSGRTNTDIPECHSPSSVSGSGVTTTGKSGRTNTDIPECHSPNQ